MKIGIDARPLQNNNRFRGIGRYLESVLRELAKLKPQDQFVFYVERRSPLPEDVFSFFNNYHLRYVAPSKIKHIKYVRALARPYVKVQLKTGDIDVFFQADPWLGIAKNVPTVATLHDLIPLFFKIEKESKNLHGVAKYKQVFGEVVQDKFYKEMLDSYQHARAITAISQASKNDYLKFVDSTANDKIFVTPLGAPGSSFAKPGVIQAAKLRQKYGLGQATFLLYVGGIDLRKNIKGLAEAFFELKASHPDLKMVMVGKEFSLKRDLKMVGWTDVLATQPELAKDIIIPGFVPDDELAMLYAEAAVFPFPSLYEGFGLPILEAMAMGCPVVAYNNSAIPEVAGNAALLVKDGASLAPAIAQILEDPELHAGLIAKGHQQVQHFTWRATVEKTLTAIEYAVKSS
jgi:glycosyltransferase involved in cell wall biosynthesis